MPVEHDGSGQSSASANLQQITRLILKTEECPWGTSGGRGQLDMFHIHMYVKYQTNALMKCAFKD